MPRTRKPPKTFAEREAEKEAKYGHYDPRKTGYGNPLVWKDIFEHVMGHAEALDVLGDESPLAVLGFSAMPTLEELKGRYRQLILENHPDKGGDHARAQRIIAAYSELKGMI